MKIAIIGTRGIPNHYGGFEQLAQWLSLGLVNKGHEVTVYNSNTHPYQESEWKGVKIIHQVDPEKTLGTIGQFIYDFNCIRDSRKRGYDIILNLGYTSSSVWMKLFPKKAIVITNMDGLEWLRTKYSKPVKYFLKHAEKWAALHSQCLVADSHYIKKYLYKKYHIDPCYIAYGAELFDEPKVDVLDKYQLKPFGYNMIVARMEPENNIEMILDGIQNSASTLPFIIVSNSNNSFGTYLKDKYQKDKRITFLGAIFENTLLNNLRYFSNIYFHGHSVGGTNPSLLEAMGCRCFIAANENEFNRAVLGDDALYFSGPQEIAKYAEKSERQSPETKHMIENNYTKIKEAYSWPKIIQHYEDLMKSQLKGV